MKADCEMPIPHAEAAQVIDIRPLGTELKTARTTTLARTDSFEMIRLVLPKGKKHSGTRFQAKSRCNVWMATSLSTPA